MAVEANHTYSNHGVQVHPVQALKAQLIGKPASDEPYTIIIVPKSARKKKVTDFGYPRACRIRKHQIQNMSPELRLPTFFKT
jgi:hypothetical protein